MKTAEQKAKHAAYMREYYKKNNDQRLKGLSRNKEWAKNNQEKVKERLLRSSYGISLDDYNTMLESQLGRCAICGDFPGTKMLSVDHDHATGKVRGLLCNGCNTRLGQMKDSIAILELAQNYLSSCRN